ncbi:hypothetical protein MMC30_003082 [Trapelia coarctata]|nr:hypothetical protein [Trapelia coarctata]
MYIEESSINGDLKYRLEWSSDPTGPVIVFVNALLTNIHIWDPVISLLKEIYPRYRFLRSELRPHNKDSAGNSRKLSLEILSTDLADLLEDLEIPKVHAVIGVGLGGAIALAFASRYPDHLNRLIGCNFDIAATEEPEPTWESPNWYSRIESARKYGMHGVQADKTVANWLPGDQRGSPLWRQVREMVASAPLESLEAGLFAYDEEDRLRSLMIPTLFISGSQDRMFPEEMKGYADRIARGMAESVVIERAGHLPMLECPERFVSVMEHFLLGVPALSR